MELVKGCGKEAETEINDKGGKQSKTVYAMHLIDGCFLTDLFKEGNVLSLIGLFFKNENKNILLVVLHKAMKEVGLLMIDVLLEIGEVLKEGAKKYEINNWRLIPQEEHLNHAIIHYIAWLKGDKQDNHIGHFFTRMMMAYATKKSNNFSYMEYKG